MHQRSDSMSPTCIFKDYAIWFIDDQCVTLEASALAGQFLKLSPKQELHALDKVWFLFARILFFLQG